MHDDEAKRCIQTTIKVECFEEFPSAEVLSDAILEALSSEGLFVVRGSGIPGHNTDKR